jgi:hypothetical protein
MSAVTPLAALNAVARWVRALGIQIIREAVRGVWPTIGHPTIVIQRDNATSVGPLLDAAQNKHKSFALPGGGSQFIVEIGIVCIIWKENT